MTRALFVLALLLSGCAERKPEPTVDLDTYYHYQRVMQARIDSLRYRAALEEQHAKLAYRLQLKARGWVPVSILTHANGDEPDTLWGHR